MKILNRLVVASLIFSCTGSVYASQLLIDLDKRVENEAEKDNKEFLTKKLYFAKHHRLVGVNPDLLDITDNITIQTFDKEPLLVEHQTTRNGDGFIFWKGRMLGIDASTLWGITDTDTGVPLTDGDANEFRGSLGKVTLLSSEVEISEDKEKKDKFSPTWAKSNKAKQPAIRIRYVRTISTRFTDVLTGRTYSLEPLPYTPDVHLWMEVDLTKGAIAIDELRGEVAAKQRENTEKYDKYLKQKGISQETSTEDERLHKYINWLTSRGVDSVSEETRPGLYRKLLDAGYDPNRLADGKKSTDGDAK